MGKSEKLLKAQQHIQKGQIQLTYQGRRLNLYHATEQMLNATPHQALFFCMTQPKKQVNHLLAYWVERFWITTDESNRIYIAST